MAAAQGGRQNIIENAQQFYTRIWRENRVLLGRVADFYRHFVSLAPSSALSPHGYRARQLGGTLALSKYESLCLAPVLGMDSSREEDFSPPPARVSLLPLTDLRHLAALAGVALLREEIMRAVARPEVQALQAAVREDVHIFALTKAATYQGHAHRVRQEMQKSQVLAPKLAPPSALELVEQGGRLPLPQRVLTLGWWCIGGCVSAGGPSLMARMQVLLPESCAALGALATEAEKAAELPQAAHTAWPLIRVLIFKELSCPWEGGWQPFFA